MTADDAVRVLDGELAAVRGELNRLDSKAATLIAVVGAVMAILTSQIGRSALPVRITLAAAGLALTGAAVLLLVMVLRPRLGSTGFCRWADTAPDEIQSLFRARPYRVAELQPADLHFLSVLVLRKQRWFRRAVDLVVLGLALVWAALVAGVVA